MELQSFFYAINFEEEKTWTWVSNIKPTEAHSSLNTSGKAFTLEHSPESKYSLTFLFEKIEQVCHPDATFLKWQLLGLEQTTL